MRPLAVLFLALTWGCDSGKATIDPSTLDPATVVFAATAGGGFLTSPEEEFFVGTRHRSFGLWIYGDRRAVVLREDTLATLGYRVYRQGMVSEAAFQALLDDAQAVGLDGGHAYSACNATDGGTEVVAVDLPGVAFQASSYLGFHVHDDCEGDAGSMGPDGKPPADLIAFFAALTSVGLVDPVVLEPDRIVLAGHGVEDAAVSPGYGCPADSPEWTVAGLALPDQDRRHLWTMSLEGQQAVDARAFVRENLQPSTDSSYGSACVQRCSLVCTQLADGHNACLTECGGLLRVYYDDVPAGEEAWPF